MSVTQNAMVETQAKPTTNLHDVVAAVRGDSPAVTARVKQSIQRAQGDDNNCMMGGWTS